MSFLVRAATQITAKLIFEGTKEKPFTLVWRLQNSRGLGPYTAELENGDSAYHHGEVWEANEHGELEGFRHKNSPEHPPPIDDSGFYPKEQVLPSKDKNIRFGFSSKAQLEKWFNQHEIKNLEKLGFKIKQLRAAKVWDSGKQAMFIPYR